MQSIMSSKQLASVLASVPDDEKLTIIINTSVVEPGPHTRYVLAMHIMDAAKGTSDYQRKVDDFIEAEAVLLRTPYGSRTQAKGILMFIAGLDESVRISIVGVGEKFRIRSPNWKPGTEQRAKAELIVDKLQEISMSMGYDSVGEFLGEYKQ